MSGKSNTIVSDDQIAIARQIMRERHESSTGRLGLADPALSGGSADSEDDLAFSDELEATEAGPFHRLDQWETYCRHIYGDLMVA